ncbi:MAG TPA: MucR family transcriptional regulator [Candidatus Deferrimicrobiaceae bacterium]|jgi:predicted transcriptional regulator
MDKKVLIELTAEIVSAHASVSEMNQDGLLSEIQAVFQKLNGLAGGEEEEVVAVPGEVKAVMPMDQAFGAEKVFCMVCGKGFTTLKKHIMVSHQMNPKQYRKAFNIPTKMALVSRNYSESKKKIAQKLGLADKLAEGRKKRAANKLAK